MAILLATAMARVISRRAKARVSRVAQSGAVAAWGALTYKALGYYCVRAIAESALRGGNWPSLGATWVNAGMRTPTVHQRGARIALQSTLHTDGAQ